MMPLKTIRLNLENCYGINKLRYEFDFCPANVYALYAPNGAMKTSLAQTFKDVVDGRASADRIFPDRITKRSIADDTGAEMSKETIFVISPYDETLGLTEKTSVLLVDPPLREEYESLHRQIEESKRNFLRLLKQQSGTKMAFKNLEKEVSAVFTPENNQFYRALKRVQSEVSAQPDAPLSQVRYDLIFNDRVLKFLATEDFKIAINDYVKKYNELLDVSTFFSRRTFNWYNASTIGKSLAKNGFFSAKHTVNLNADTPVEVSSEEELEALIEKEKESIASDPNLRIKYAAIEKLLTRNQPLRDFQGHLSENEMLLPKLANIDRLKEEIWLFHFKNNLQVYESLLMEYDRVSARIAEIEHEAVKQRTHWEAVIEEFNSRFFVPFRLVVENRERVILGADSIPRLGFIFQEDEGQEETKVTRETLMKRLSTGEKKALYILNIIFEVEARKKERQDTVFVFDDIADSFDYRNKYAIIQYLMDISEEPFFNQLLLTHNFDFFRTVNSRFVGYKQCLMASRTSEGVEITQAEGIKNPFVRDWKLHFFDDPRKRLASIPFLRNLMEYMKGPEDAGFEMLTSLLQWKPDSCGITQTDLDDIYKEMFGDEGEEWSDGHASVLATISDTAQGLMEHTGITDGIHIENKIVLSIGIRLAAEEFMVNRIDDADVVSNIRSNQTQKLLKRYEEDCGHDDIKVLEILKRVVLMTPENIHLNSFMYEPIVDMSGEHLRKLYAEVQGLEARANIAPG